MVNADVQYDADGNIIDFLSDKHLKKTPEEIVRQSFIKILNSDYNYPLDCMKREVPIWHGSKKLTNEKGDIIRADIVVYNSKTAALKDDQGNILFVAECKKPTATEGYNQLVSYIYNTSAVGGIWTNGNDIEIYVKNDENNGLNPLLSLPSYKSDWKSTKDQIPTKDKLPRPKNIRFLLSTCHNKLYGHGMENADFDLTMDMVRILLAKIQDETEPGNTPQFWITEKDASTAEGRAQTAQIIQNLFRKYAGQYPDIFDEHEKITVGDDCIAEAVGVLQGWSLAARNDDADDWDLMGETYEQFTHIHLKRQQGQFFTNRLVVNMMVDILDPEIGEKALDPAGGGGGFATAIFRYLRRKVVKNTKTGSPARDRQLQTIKDSVYTVEIAARLVKIAKCAMLMTGDGQSGMTRGDSLSPYSRLDPWIQSRCCGDTSTAPEVIATNPPFSGQKAESQKTDKEILKDYDFGHAFTDNGNGGYRFIKQDDAILDRQAPELLFVEKCIRWLKPGGRMAIVLPKGILDNISYEAYRWWLLDKCEVRAIITLHKDTFQPDTGVRTCVIVLHKPKSGETPRKDYDIFMAQSQRIGQDSKGNSVYVLDSNGNSTGQLNQDLTDIAAAYRDFDKSGVITKPSEFIFSVKLSDIKDHINLNPQHYSPKLNKAMDKVLGFNDRDGWSVTTVGQLESDMNIYIGPRWSSSNIKIENPSDTTALTPYLTANGALELRRFTVKWMDLSKASQQQKAYASMLRVEEGDILITRSGTIGKVTYATKDMAKKYLVSDDLVRIRVKDKTLREYLLAYFASETALSLMLLDEYGSVQQHLQPRHIQEMLVPIPDDWRDAADMIEAGRKLISAMENLSKADNAIKNNSLGF
ncbi:MAG: N-6 DNA methylase [Lachnospiraceae bacterium]|nr:N-6 DNA methylase [Lachnospiraceae bacterium]